MALEKELSVYRMHLPDLLSNEGKYVVIKGEHIIQESFSDYESALAAGYNEFGPVSFLVKKIQRTEPVLYYSREV